MPEKKKDYHTEGMLCHLLALTAIIGVPVGNILGPLIMWMTKKDESEYVDYHGKESLNFPNPFHTTCGTFSCFGYSMGIA